MGKTGRAVGKCGQVHSGRKSQLLIGQEDKNIIVKTQKTVKNKNLNGMISQETCTDRKNMHFSQAWFFNCHILVYKKASILRDLYHKEK